jgi:hypothetical protein
MQTYVREVERLGDVTPWQTESGMERWREGKAVDLFS